MNINELTKLSYEELAHALYMKGIQDGHSKITDKTGWREKVVGDKLNHEVYKSISSGKGTLGEGSDAKCRKSGQRAEYKSKALEDKNLNNLFERPYSHRSTGNYAPREITGIYNNAMKPGAIESYKEIDHYFGLFYRERCVLIIKVDTNHVVSSLRSQVEKRKNATSTNLCTVEVTLRDKHLYEVAFKEQGFFDKHSQKKS